MPRRYAARRSGWGRGRGWGWAWLTNHMLGLRLDPGYRADVSTIGDRGQGRTSGDTEAATPAGTAGPGEPAAGPTPPAGPGEPVAGPTFGRVRRAPRYLPFMLTGGLIGVLLTLLLAALPRQLSDPLAAATPGAGRGYSTTQVLLYVGPGLVAVGGALGAAVALVLERRRR